MADTRLVHSILYSRKLKNRAMIAFIQHGTRETGFRYEVICPYCAHTTGYVTEEVDDIGPVELGPKELSIEMKRLMSIHLPKCTDSWTKVKVQKATRPLGTEKIIREM